MQASRRRAVALAVALCVAALAPAVVAGAGPASGATGAVGGEATNDVPDAGAVNDAPPAVLTPANNSTRHRDPDRTNEDGDLGAVGGWLERSMAGRLEASAVNLSQGEYEAARSVLGDEYDSQFAKYVDVEGETGGDGTARQFREASDQQRNLSSDVSEYRRTLEQYREARENGDEQRARRLARKLERLQGRISTTAEDLNRTYVNLSAATGADLSEAQESITRVEDNVSEQQQSVRSETFVETSLELTAANPEISFADPLALRGRLVAANGTALANRSVVLAIRGRTLRVRTNATGWFSARFRPTTMPLGEGELRVAYRPRNVSLYLGTTGTVPVNVSQVAATATIAEAPSTVAFGDAVTIRGRVAAEGAGAEAVPVAVSLGGVELGTVRTGPDGTFALTATVPAGVVDGARELRVESALEGRALAVTGATTEVTVESTATSLSLAASNASRGVFLDGRLTTADGTPLSDRAVVLRVDGEQVRTVRTGADGRFAATLAAQNASSVTVVAAFDGDGTSLEGARDSASLALGGDGAGGTQFPLSSALAWLLAAGVLLLAGGALYRFRDGDDPPEQDGSAAVPSGDDGAAVASVDSGTATDDAAGPSLSTARDQLAAGAHDEAVGAAYVAARAAVAERTGAASSGTHWEFLAACEADGVPGDDVETLRELTADYERAAFAPAGVDDETAEAAVERAAELGA